MASSVASGRSHRSAISYASFRSTRSRRSARDAAQATKEHVELNHFLSPPGTNVASTQPKEKSLKDSMSSTEYIGEVNGNGSSSASVSSHRSSNSHRSASSRGSKSSKSSKKATKDDDLNDRLRRISEQSGLTGAAGDASSAASWRSPYQSSAASGSAASHSSKSSKSSRTSKTSSTVPIDNTSKLNHFLSPPKTKKSSGASVASHRSSSSSKSGKSGKSSKGQVADAIDYLESGNYNLAIVLFTQALEKHPKGNEKQGQQSAATLHGYRAEGLYQVGAYEAAVRDARNALDYERSSREVVGDHPYSASGRPSHEFLHPERGMVLRARALCTLGHSLLRGGYVEGVSAAFEDCDAICKTALDDEEDLTESARNSSASHKRAVQLVKETLEKAKEGFYSLESYEMRKTRLDTGSYKKEYLDLLDGALEIAPASTDLHVQKVKYLIRRRRWFAVANHCEQLAARATKYDGIFHGDLVDMDPFPGVPALQELSSNVFDEDSTGKGPPPHLRKLDQKATRDAVFRLPPELLPYYLRALRLEERYKEAVLAGTALAEFDADAKDRGEEKFAENRRFDKEWDKLDRTIKMKEEADALFRDAYYDRAVRLYGECLAVDGDKDGSILRQSSSWPVACPKANDAGGKLHAVLHSNRAACFLSMGRYEDAAKECSHAIEIHSMYCKALLRRARCYSKLGQPEKARADFQRYVILVEGARDHPYPPVNQGSACYFDMPSDVSDQQLRAVKSEMNELGLKPASAERGKRQNKINDWLANLTKTMSSMSCCKKNAASQVATHPSHWPSVSRRSSRSSSGGPTRRVSFDGPSPQSFPPDPPNNSLIKPRPAFDHPLDPPSAIDTSIDYYATLGLTSAASDSEIKHSYHKLARDSHPDRNKSAEAQTRFQEVKVAYAILGDAKKKREYDKATSRLDP